MGMGSAKIVDPPGILLVLNTQTHPNILRPVDEPVELAQIIRALRKDLKLVPIGAAYDVKHLKEIGYRHVLVKQVTHRVDEDTLRFPPLQRKVQHVGLKRQLEAITVIPLPHSLQTLCNAFGITVLTAGTDFDTSCDRIPGGLRPFNRGIRAHLQPPFENVMRTSSANVHGRLFVPPGLVALSLPSFSICFSTVL